jgi:hypothetical protein
MGTTQDHRRYAEQCVAMARRSGDKSDKALWITLAQSWVRLAEHVARSEMTVVRPLALANLDDLPEIAAAEKLSA